MSNSSPKSINSILGQTPDSLIKRLLTQQSDNHTLLDYLKTNLPRKQAQHLVAIHCRNDILVLVADKPAWANLLRYQTASLFKQMQQDAKVFGQLSTKDIKKIVVRTAAAELR